MDVYKNGAQVYYGDTGIDVGATLNPLFTRLVKSRNGSMSCWYGTNLNSMTQFGNTYNGLDSSIVNMSVGLFTYQLGMPAPDYPVVKTRFNWFDFETNQTENPPTPPITVHEPVWVEPTPPDNAKNNTQVMFNFDCGTDEKFMWFDNQTVPKTRVITNSTPQNYTTSVISDGNYYAAAACYNITNNLFSSNITRTWTYDASIPTVNVNGDNFFTEQNLTNINNYGSSIRFNFSFADNIDLYQFEINMSNNGVTQYSNNTLISGTSYNWVHNLSIANFAEGVYTITMLVADSHTASAIKNYDLEMQQKKLSFQTAEGNSISIESVDGSLPSAKKIVDRYEFGFEFDDGLTKNRDFIVTSDRPIVYRPNSGYAGHFVIWNGEQGNWIDFEGVGKKPTVTKIDDYNYRVRFSNIDSKVKFQSIGGLNVVEKTYQWYRGTYTLNNQSVSSGETTQFQLDINKNAGTIIALGAEFFYNNTNRSNNISATVGSTSNQYAVNVKVPAVTSDTNIDYFWKVHVQAKEKNYTFFQNGQQITSFWLFDNCTSALTPTATLRIFNENNPTSPLVANVETNIQYWVGSPLNYKDYLANLNGSSTYNLCLLPNGQNISANVYLKYTTIGGFTHRYILKNYSFSNITQNLDMYNWDTTTGASNLKITVRDPATFNVLPNVVAKLQRLYVSENVWRTVQMDSTGDLGLLFYNVIEETTDYRLIFSNYDNQILKTSDNLKFICDANICDITYTLDRLSTETTSPDLNVNISYNNATKTISAFFDDPLGLTSNVRLYVTKETGAGSTELCNTNVSASTGTLQCFIGTQTGQLHIKIYSSASPEVPKLVEWLFIAANPLYTILTKKDSSIWTTGMIVTAAGFGAMISPVAAIFTTIFALIAAMLLGMNSVLTITSIMVIAILGLIVGLKVRN
jgi:hypothetical protein